ncbi:uncharacterized protein L201_001096 [Kwoniella dendrophila CBS 6074]|uniref:Uncharacterized protein n=1 Tax=Kwoniella dendrophila CBS 6074 TaxID=1295534 RepID=A0AAX4JMT8_9TREE
MSPELLGQLPSFQVTHPTPTKAIKFRRKSTDVLSVSTASSFDPSPLGQAQILQSPGTGTLDVSVEAPNNAASGSRSRARSPEIDLEDDDSEAERVRLEEKQARVREKGRERQRRKRERDKKAKEAKTSSAPSCHLPVPITSQSKSPAHSLSISVPSSVSTMASSLPQSASYFSVSPAGNPFGMLPGSTSVSGASTPVTLLSPSGSTPALGYSPDTSMSASLFSLGLEGAISNGMLELPMDKPSKRTTRGKGKVITNSTTHSRKVSPTPLLTDLPQAQRDAKPPTIKSAKRRKSEPQTDELFNIGMTMTGLGVTTVQDEPPQPTWPIKVSEGSRPQPRRTASDGVVIRANHERERDWGARSPTPPPVPTLPSEYRQIKSIRPSVSTETMSDTDSSPSAQSEVFATRLLYLLKKDEVETGWLNNQIGLNTSEIDDMKHALKCVYDKWILEKGIKEMSLDSSEGVTNSQPSSTNMTPSSTYMNQSSVPTSPVINAAMSASGFFTPLPQSRSSSRRGEKRPTISIGESPLTSQTSSSHGRQRSLSSASMIARGLHITSQVPSQPPQQWSHPTTPVLPQETVSNPTNEPKSDDTASPVNSSLQTPSTGQGSFPTSEQMTAYHGHWRSATDPVGQRVYTTFQYPPQTPVQEQNINQINGLWQVPNTCPPVQHHASRHQLDSPLASTAMNKSGQIDMPPPLPASSQGIATVGLNGHSALPDSSRMTSQQHMDSFEHMRSHMDSDNGHQRHFSTPVTSRTQPISHRNIMAVPFTPGTPVQVRGQNHSTVDAATISMMPVWYNQAFMASSSSSSHPQVLQSPIIERNHGGLHGNQTNEHQIQHDVEMGSFLADSVQHGF